MNIYPKRGSISKHVFRADFFYTLNSIYSNCMLAHYHFMYLLVCCPSIFFFFLFSVQFIYYLRNAYTVHVTSNDKFIKKKKKYQHLIVWWIHEINQSNITYSSFAIGTAKTCAKPFHDKCLTFVLNVSTSKESN